MKTTRDLILGLIILLVFLSSCDRIVTNQQDIIDDLFLEAQDEITNAIHSIVRDAEEANIAGLKSAHLESLKFSQFGPRNFQRQDLKQTNESEGAFFGSISNYKQEVRDLKIDVFDDMAIATYYPYVSFIQDGVKKTGNGRQTFVFIMTEDGWKIVHEHGTPK